MGDNELEMIVTGEKTADGSNTATIGGKITVDTVRKWQEILRKYKTGKKHLEERIVDAEQAWKLRHWEQIRKRDVGDPEPASGWLVNVILAKHSDACDNYPSPVCLPREPDDEQTAKSLSSILPVILEQNHFDSTWSDVWWYKLKSGTGVYGVYWEPDKLGGLGDISIQKVEILNLFWEPGITDIQDSRYVFQVKLVDNEVLEQEYPQLKGKLKTGTTTLTRYIYEDQIDTSNKSEVVDVYYKVKKEGGKSILHFAKYVNEELLYATENDTTGQTEDRLDPVSGQTYPVEIRPPMSETGLYQHGLYPFVFDALFPEEGYPNCGFGYVDLCKDPQKYIDLMDNALLKNMLANATPRWFIRADGGINETEYGDLTKSFVHVQGRLGEDALMPVQSTGLGEVFVSLKQLKIDELKQVAGNRDVNNGGTGGNVTAASAIAALQEAGNGISRDMISSAYRAFAKVVNLCIELIREFYDIPRQFRILGDNGQPAFVSFDNSGIRPQPQGMDFGIDMGYRSPMFDIEVDVEKDAQYKTAAYNELAVQLYQLGAFNPQMADQVLPMIDMMEFKGKDTVKQTIAQNAKLQQYAMIALQLAAKYNPMLYAQMAQDMGIAPQMGAPAPSAPAGAADVKIAPDGRTGNAYLDKAYASAEGGSSPR